MNTAIDQALGPLDALAGADRLGLGRPPLPAGPARVQSLDPKSDLQREHQPYPRFRLPTEAEWEYVCRAGTTGPFSFGDDITPEQANYDGNFPYRETKKGLYRQATVDVASLPINPWGLYKMHGNVWKRCWDRYGDYPAGPVTNPVALRRAVRAS